MNEHQLRGHLLLSQERYDQAIAELMQALAVAPDDGHIHATLALAFLRTGKWHEASNWAKTAESKAPGDGFVHWVAALVWLERGHLKEARASGQTALELDPDDPDHHGLMARVAYEGNSHQEAVAHAGAGLALDPKNDLCLTVRSRALMALGRDQDADSDVQTLLADAPEDAWNHCLRGDQLLAQGDFDSARRHYLESLRLDPRNEAGRHGLVLTLKARSAIYGIFLRSLLWLGKHRGWSLWLLAPLIFFGLNAGDSLATKHPDWLLPYAIVKNLFWAAVLCLAIADPLFDVLLRFDREGRHALTEDETRATTWHLILFALAALCAVWSYAYKATLGPLLGMSFLFFCSAVAEVFRSPPGYVRRRMAALTIITGFTILLTPFVLVIGVLLLAMKQQAAGLFVIQKALYLPLIAVIFSSVADNIREWLEKRRPEGA